MLLGSAGNHVQQMKAMGFGWKGDWSKGWGKGWDWGKGYNMYMQMPVWKGYGKGW